MPRARPLFLALCLLLLVPGGAIARGGDPGAELETVAPTLAGKLAALAPGETIGVVVRLRDQARLPALPGASRASRLRAVVSALKSKAAATQGPIAALLETRRAQGRVAEFTPLWVFNGLAVTATAEVVRELAARPDVAAVTADEEIAAPAVSESAPAEPNLALVNAPALWDLGLTGQGIVVANLDTGVDVSHPDLAARWRGGTNSWYDPNGEHPTTPTDVNGHGTWTMGVMAGGDAGGTAIGVAPEAQWIAVKIFDDRDVATTSRIHQGFQWLLDPDGNTATADAPHVVSNSWTLGSAGCSLEFQLDLQSLRSAGILPVFAAGNYGPGAGTSASPGNNPEAFAVGATRNNDVIWSGSSRGPSACGEPATTFPDLVAPGVSIRTSDLFGLYTQQTGTSLAAPHVAGALALLLDAYPNLGADAQEAALETGAVDLGVAGPDDTFGHGRLDILAAYESIVPAPSDFTISATPSSQSTSPGAGAGYTVSVTPSGGFAGDVELALSGLTPEQATWSFAPATIAGGSGSSQLTIATSSTLSPGSYALTITGTSGPLTRITTVTLVVTAPGDFAISVSPSSRTVKRGKSTSYTVGVSSQGGFAGTVALSVTGLPPGATATLVPDSVVAPGSATMTVKTSGKTPRGTFLLTVSGTSGASVRQATASLTVA
jgi:subtilisin family serine protease